MEIGCLVAGAHTNRHTHIGANKCIKQLLFGEVQIECRINQSIY